MFCICWVDHLSVVIVKTDFDRWRFRNNRVNGDLSLFWLICRSDSCDWIILGGDQDLGFGLVKESVKAKVSFVDIKLAIDMEMLAEGEIVLEKIELIRILMGLQL